MCADQRLYQVTHAAADRQSLKRVNAACGSAKRTFEQHVQPVSADNFKVEIVCDAADHRAITNHRDVAARTTVGAAAQPRDAVGQRSGGERSAHGGGRAKRSVRERVSIVVKVLGVKAVRHRDRERSIAKPVPHLQRARADRSRSDGARQWWAVREAAA